MHRKRSPKEIRAAKEVLLAAGLQILGLRRFQEVSGAIWLCETAAERVAQAAPAQRLTLAEKLVRIIARRDAAEERGFFGRARVKVKFKDMDL